MAKKETTAVVGTEGIYDARTLGGGKMMVLGLQHVFAMFGATILVPVITGLSVTTTLLFAGIGTLLFHFLTKGKVPAFLGSSFAFLGGYASVAAMFGDTEAINWIPYAGVGVAAISYDTGAVKYAHRKGLYVLELTGEDTFTLSAPNNPKAF